MISILSTVTQNPYFRLIRTHVSVWLIPTVAIGCLGTAYALFKPSVWEASQGFLVRDSLLEQQNQNGRFNTTDARKAAQETILEVARNRQVVINTLREVVPKKKQGRRFPDDSLISEFQDAIAVTAPKGAEFGETDLIYLRVKGRTPSSAIENTSAVGKHTQLYLNYLRDRRTESVSQELREKLALTQAKLDAATEALEAMERDVGSDLGELRTLNQSASGASNVRNQIGQTKSELRAARTKQTGQIKSLEFLLAARKNTELIVATPSSVLASQPALQRLKDGLVDAQLKLSDLRGKMNSTHPRVRSAETAVAEIQRNLHSELEVAIRASRADLQVTNALIASFNQQLEQLQDRFKVVGSLRARYENLVANVRDWSEQVKDGQRALANADASLETTTSQITLVDEPDVGDRPIGPGRTILVLASWAGGLFTGLGLLFLLAPPNGEGSLRGIGRRASDHEGANDGRRMSDRQAAESQPATQASTEAIDTHPETRRFARERLVKNPRERRFRSAKDAAQGETQDQPAPPSNEQQPPAPFPSIELDQGDSPLTDPQQS